jgi:hypothetical protein
MAISPDHITVSSAGLSSGASLTTSSSTGNLSAVAICLSAVAGLVNSVTDNKSNAYLLGVKKDDTLSDLEIWYAPNATTGITSVTVTFVGTATMLFAVYDCSGALTTNPFVNADFIESNATGSTATTNPVGPTVNYNYGGTFSIAICFSTGSVSAVSSPYTLDLASHNGLAHAAFAGTGVFQPSWTTLVSQPWAGVNALFASNAGSNNIRFLKGKSGSNLPSIQASPVTTAIGDLVILIDVSSGGSAPFFTDNKGNTFINVPGMNPFSGGGGDSNVGYCILTSAGTNHIFQFNSAFNTTGPILGIVITPNITPTLTDKNIAFTSSSGTTFTGVSCTPHAGDYLFNWTDVQDGQESSFTANGSWILGPFELDGNSYSDPQTLTYQLNAVGGSTSDNSSVSPNAASAVEAIIAFTIAASSPSNIYPNDLTPGTNVVFEIA